MYKMCEYVVPANTLSQRYYAVSPIEVMNIVYGKH